MSTVPFVTTIADDGSAEARKWNVAMTAAMRQAGMWVLPLAKIDQCDVVLVSGQSTRSTAARALALAPKTERGALFAVWINPYEVAVFLQPVDGRDPAAVWRRKLLENPLSLIDENALECNVLALATTAMRDGVSTSVRIEYQDAFPRVAGRILHPEQGVPKG